MTSRRAISSKDLRDLADEIRSLKRVNWVTAAIVTVVVVGAHAAAFVVSYQVERVNVRLEEQMRTHHEIMTQTMAAIAAQASQRER